MNKKAVLGPVIKQDVCRSDMMCVSEGNTYDFIMPDNFMRLSNMIQDTCFGLNPDLYVAAMLAQNIFYENAAQHGSKKISASTGMLTVPIVTKMFRTERYVIFSVTNPIDIYDRIPKKFLNRMIDAASVASITSFQRMTNTVSASSGKGHGLLALGMKMAPVGGFIFFRETENRFAATSVPCTEAFLVMPVVNDYETQNRHAEYVGELIEEIAELSSNFPNEEERVPVSCLRSA